MRRKQNFQTIAWFWDLYNRNLLDLDPPYQRRSVWNQSFKDYYIDTILQEYPSPAVFLYEEIDPDGRAMYHVVDGKQRLMTIFEFIRNNFPVAEKAETARFRGLYFLDLSDDTKRTFWSYLFSVEYLPTDDESIINNIFDRINRNTARLTAQELRHARFDGEFITVCEDLAGWLVSELPTGFPSLTFQSRQQMKDVEFVASVLLLFERGPRSYSTLQLDEEFASRDVEWESKNEIVSRFRTVVTFIKQLLSTPDGKIIAGTRIKNQADAYSLFGAIDGLVQEGVLPDFEQWPSRLLTFVRVVQDEESRNEVENARSYFEAARSASNDLGPRSTRIRILQDVLRGINN